MKHSGALWLSCILPFLLCLPSVATAQDFECPQPIKQVSNNIKGDLNGKAQTILKLGAAEIQGQFETTVVELISKYQNADRVAIAQNLLSTACGALKTASDLSGSQKFDKWLQLFPLMERFFQDKRSEIVPEPKETKGVFISYKKSFHDADLILEAFKSAGIRVDVVASDCRNCKTTSLFCDPYTEKETVLKVALTLFDAGVRLTRITPGHLPVGPDSPAIELNAHLDSEARPLSRTQIEAITDCQQEYLADRTHGRLFGIENDCPDTLYFWYLTFNSETSEWNPILSSLAFPDYSSFLTDESGAYLLTNNNPLYYYAEADHPNDRENPFVWSGSKDDGTSVLQTLEDGRDVYFQRITFPQRTGPGVYTLPFTCPSQR